jgi:hypothetical protein
MQVNVNVRAQYLLLKYAGAGEISDDFWWRLYRCEDHCWCSGSCKNRDDAWHNELADVLCAVIPCTHIRTDHENPGASAMIRRVKRGELNGPAWLYRVWLYSVCKNKWESGDKRRFELPFLILSYVVHTSSHVNRTMAEILSIANRWQLHYTAIFRCLISFPKLHGEICSLISDDAQKVDLCKCCTAPFYHLDQRKEVIEAIQIVERLQKRQVHYAKRFPRLLERILNDVSPHFPSRAIASLVSRRILWP